METQQRIAPLWRRLGAMLYDALAVIAVWMLATGILLIFTNGQAINSHVIWYKIYLSLVATGFFVFFWLKSGQTLGMKAWRIQLINMDKTSSVTFDQALQRFLMAIISWGCCGLGIIWMLFDKQSRTWQDMASKTQLIHLPPLEKGD